MRALVLAFTLLLTACASRPVAAPEGVTLTPLRSIPALQARAMVALTGLKGVSAQYGVDLYRMTYSAPDASGRPMRLTALLALPRGVAARRLVSFQHGTSTTPTAVPSRPDGTGLGAAVAFASNGYALLAPDYAGMGPLRDRRHHYYIADEAGRAVAGAVEAALRVSGVPDRPVFLTGFSQGGQTSFAAAARLEADGHRLLGLAPVAGAYDLMQFALPAALKGGARSHALYLAYVAWGYSDWHRQPLDSVLTPEMARRVDDLFGRPAKPREILEGLPADPRALFQPQALAALEGRGVHWFADAVAANSVAGVTPHAPVRLYYGSADADVTPQESRAAAERLSARGVDAQAIDVGPVGHDPSMLAAAPRILAWLRELEAAR